MGSEDEQGLQDLMGPPPPGTVVNYLTGIGYKLLSPDLWQTVAGHAPFADSQPQLDIYVTAHSEADGHTWYFLYCHLTHPGKRHWTVYRRLAHMRKFLHDPIKSQLGSEYRKHFDGETARFASHGGPEGTTDKLRGWFKALTTLINSGGASPNLVALTLRFLQSDDLETEDELGFQAVGGAEPAQENAFREQPVQDNALEDTEYV